MPSLAELRAMLIAETVYLIRAAAQPVLAVVSAPISS